MANPTGLTVGHGSATAQQNGSQLTITASQNAFLNWQSFNIAAGETTIFNQPSASSVVWNRINDPNPSQIYGTLQANGVVVLLNSSGFYFGPHSFVSAAGLVVSTANCAPPENSGGSWEFNGPPPLASIVNYGRISVGQSGSAFLIADQIENHGTIAAPGGTVGLASGQTVLLSERPDGRGLSMQVTLPQGSVDNYGTLIADAGTIAMNAKVINQEGLLQANSVQNKNGVIELVADDQLNLGAGSQIVASGDDSSPGSSGGSVTLQSKNNFSDNAGSKIVLTGGAQGGNGGDVEISAPNILSLHSSINARAASGSTAGKLLLDPDYIILDSSGPDTAGGGSVLAGDHPGGTLDLNVNTAFANVAVSEVMLQAKQDITIADGTFWSLSDTIGKNFGGITSGHLILEAGQNIIFGDGSKIFDANNWAVTLKAGVNDFTAGTVQPGIGSIYLGGYDGTAPQNFSGSIQTSSGPVDLTAGVDILVGSGSVITTGGGSITAHALAGNIDTGSDAQGYHFESGADSLDDAYDLSGGLGGISTAAGGNVNLTAGGNVTSILPANNGFIYDGNQLPPLNNDYTTAGSGAYGRQTGQAGNVTVVAGGDVTGHYLVANGVGNIFAGVKMDANGNPVKDVSGNYVLGVSGNAGGADQSNPGLALNLITGGWNVTAAQNIFLQEVRNPNGVFDVDGGAAFKHYFDYAPGDYVNLSAGNLVQLGASASALPRLDKINGTSVPVIYPSILNVTAGAGGVELGSPGSPNSLILFPPRKAASPSTRRKGGSLAGNLDLVQGTPQIFNLIVSDSGKAQYQSSGDFGLNDHAATPVHLGSQTPLTLDISGDMSLVQLGAPEAAQINVAGNMYNSRFQGMNLSAADTTTIQVTGDIINRSAFSSVDLNQVSGAQAPDLSLLLRAVNNSIGGSSISAATLSTSLYYNPTTQTLTYQNIQGKSLASVLQLLQNLTIQKVDAKGNLLWLDPEQTIPDTMTVSILNPGTAQALQAQYDKINLQSGLPTGVNPPASGSYTIGGGGNFDVSAQSIDLGTTAGIQSIGVGLYRVGGIYPLANLFNHGADISITTSGDLDMFSSSIASLNGGSIYVNAGGAINVGSPDFSVNASGARGIFSTGEGDVAVYAGQNININGSRIATYDGGNVTVESFNGDINAGTGGLGSVVPTAYYVDPVTHQVYSTSPTTYGSGILASTFGPRDASYPAPGAVVGNILAEAPNGSVIADKGGILQLAFNNSPVKRGKKHQHGPPPPPPPDDSHATVEVLAGYELRNAIGQPLTAADIAGGTPVSVSTARNIDASGSGVIAQNVVLQASGDINGVIFARGNIDVSAIANVNVTALAQGTVTASAGGDLSGTIIGVGGISASGGSVDASLLSNGSISGATSGQSGLAQGTAANAASTAASNDSSQTADATATTTGDGSDDETKKKKPIALAQKVSRVTVILPTKTN